MPESLRITERHEDPYAWALTQAARLRRGSEESVNGFGRVLLTGGVPADAVGVESALDSRRHARRGDGPDLFFPQTPFGDRAATLRWARWPCRSGMDGVEGMYSGGWIQR